MLVNEEMDKASSEYHERLKAVNRMGYVSYRLDRLYDALETGTLDLKDLAPRIQALRQRQEQLQTTRWELDQMISDRKAELADMHIVTHWVEDLRNLLSHSSITREKRSLRALLERL